jgi:hypothetical protein
MRAAMLLAVDTLRKCLGEASEDSVILLAIE